MAGAVRLKRVYEPKAPDDGFRVLVDRLWPRGVSKSEAAADLWLKDVAPSAELRRWFDHRPDRWETFRQRYETELASNPALQTLRRLADTSDVTLLYAAKDQAHNNAVVLTALLATHRQGG